jgi:hypothetical protein
VILLPDEKSCSNCGALIPADSLFCEKCGQPLGGVPPEPLPYEPGAKPYESPPPARVPPPYRPQRRTNTRFLLSVVGTAVAVILLFATVIGPSLSSITGPHATDNRASGSPSVTPVTSSPSPTPTPQTSPLVTISPTSTPGGAPFPTQVSATRIDSVTQGQPVTFVTTLYSPNEHKNICGAPNYYIDNYAAGGKWNVNPPGTCSASSGSLSFSGTDTAQLSPGTHTLKVDYLGDSTHAGSQFVEQFTVTA